MSEQYNVHEAKTKFSQLLVKVENGEDVIIARGGIPVARLVRLASVKKPKFGFAKGLLPEISQAEWDKYKAEFRASFREDKWV